MGVEYMPRANMYRQPGYGSVHVTYSMLVRCRRMWFLPLTAARLMRLGIDPLVASAAGDGWYSRFARKVLEGEPDVLALVRVPPQLQGRRLDAVRTLMYDYQFSDGSKSWAEQQQQQQQPSGKKEEGEGEKVEGRIGEN